MKYTFPAIACLISLLTFGQQTNETILIGGQNRSYIQYLPTGFDVVTESLPVVVVLHGLGDNASNMSGVGTNNIADTARFIALYPQGKPNPFGQNAWNNGTFLASSADDVGFINALIDEMINFKNVDPTRIYVTGFSMGGIMSYTLACELNDRIAAVASMAGTMSTDDLSNCAPSYKTPVMHLHGTSDGTVPYDGTALPSLSLVPQTIAFWEGVHTCSATPDSTQMPDTANDGITVDRFVWTGCSPEGSLELWRFNGADHIYLYEPVNDITEAKEIWRFFRKWSHSNPAPADVVENSSVMVNIYPNPTKESITISVTSDITVSIVDATGKIFLEKELVPGETTINTSELEAGVYHIYASNGYAERLVIQ